MESGIAELKCQHGDMQLHLLGHAAYRSGIHISHFTGRVYFLCFCVGGVCFEVQRVERREKSEGWREEEVVEGSKYGEVRERDWVCEVSLCVRCPHRAQAIWYLIEKRKIKGVISTLVLMFSSCRPHSLSITGYTHICAFLCLVYIREVFYRSKLCSVDFYLPVVNFLFFFEIAVVNFLMCLIFKLWAFQN